jgi:hypothetical protein
MTKRLEQALRQLSPEEAEKVADFAEALASRHAAAVAADDRRFLKLDWIGKAAAMYPEHASGVDAAHAAIRMIAESIERALPR